jgi:hypothetical protein
MRAFTAFDKRAQDVECSSVDADDGEASQGLCWSK